MKTDRIAALLSVSALILGSAASCTKDEHSATEASNAASGQAAVQDNVSAKNIVQLAVGSKDLTTLVTALKAADLVDVLANPGPFTVFAPVNSAFEKLPKGTVEGLLKADKKAALQDILQYHVTTSTMKKEYFTDGQTIGVVNGDSVNIAVKAGVVTVNGAKIIASVPASNGIVHLIDGVLLPPAKSQ